MNFIENWPQNTTDADIQEPTSQGKSVPATYILFRHVITLSSGDSIHTHPVEAKHTLVYRWCFWSAQNLTKVSSRAYLVYHSTNTCPPGLKICIPLFSLAGNRLETVHLSYSQLLDHNQGVFDKISKEAPIENIQICLIEQVLRSRIKIKLQPYHIWP